MPAPETHTPAPAPRIAVAIVEDHAFLRELLSDALGRVDGLQVAGAYADSTACIDGCRTTRPDVLLVDAMLAQESGIDAIRDLRRAAPRSEVLVFSGALSAFLVQRAVAAGARGYVEKTVPFDELVQAVRTVAASRPYFSEHTRALLPDTGPASATMPAGKMLARRELEVLRAIAEGRMTKEIAAEQGRSIYTIENQRRKILQKTGLTSVAELTRLAVDLGLIAPTPRPTRAIA